MSWPDYLSWIMARGPGEGEEEGEVGRGREEGEGAGPKGGGRGSRHGEGKCLPFACRRMRWCRVSVNQRNTFGVMRKRLIISFLYLTFTKAYISKTRAPRRSSRTIWRYNLGLKNTKSSGNQKIYIYISFIQDLCP